MSNFYWRGWRGLVSSIHANLWGYGGLVFFYYSPAVFLFLRVNFGEVVPRCLFCSRLVGHCGLIVQWNFRASMLFVFYLCGWVRPRRVFWMYITNSFVQALLFSDHLLYVISNFGPMWGFRGIFYLFFVVWLVSFYRFRFFLYRVFRVVTS